MSKLRRTLRSWHRDIGYFVFGFTLIFSISGIAVNHIEDWNPNYDISRVEKIVPSISKNIKEKKLLSLVKKNLNIQEGYKTLFWESPTKLKFFFKNELTIFIDLESKKVISEKITPRPIFFVFNQLHLNSIKGTWSFVSDLFAIGLIFLAISGLILVRGNKGFIGRGGIFTAIGILIPFLFLIFS